MHSIKYLCVLAILFASCRVSRNTAATTNDEVKPTIAVAISPGTHTHPEETSTTSAAEPAIDKQDSFRTESIEKEIPKANTILTTTNSKKRITSFAQLKEMTHNGKVAMNRKDLKTLNRLEKHYKGNYEQFRADTFEFTDKAKIIGGIGLLGLLLAIITGSALGWFLFIVAALAFLLRYLNIIAF